MKLSEEKSVYQCVRNKGVGRVDTCTRIWGKEIKGEEVAKFLGLKVDAHMSWTPHLLELRGPEMKLKPR